MESAAGALKAASAAAMIYAGLSSFAQTSLYPLAEGWAQAVLGPVSLHAVLLLFTALMALAVGVLGKTSARLAYLSALLLYLSAALAHTCTCAERFGACFQTAMPLDRVVLAGVFIQACYLLLHRTVSAESSYAELVRRGADRREARAVLFGQLSLSASLAFLSFSVPALLFFLLVRVRGGIAGIAGSVPFSAFVVPLVFATAIVLSTMLYLVSAREEAGSRPAPSPSTESGPLAGSQNYKSA